MKEIHFLIFSSLFFTCLWGTDFTVSNNRDSGPGSLRQAIIDFNAASDSNNIVFAEGLPGIAIFSSLPLLSKEGNIVFLEGTLLINSGSPTRRIFGGQNVNINIQILDTHTFNLDLNGLTDGNGALIVSGGAGHLFLQGEKTYSGGTILSGNISLVINGPGINPTGGVTLADNSTLDINDISAPSQTISALSSSSLDTTVILQDKILIVDSAISTEYMGSITGTSQSSFIKRGLGTLALTGSTPEFEGSVLIEAGTLLVNGTLGDGTNTFTVFPNAILGGSGTVSGSVINNGSVQPGNSIGSLTINGDYTQNASLVIEINETGASDLLVVSGSATLNGALQVIPEPGVYLKGTTYTFLAADSITGQFSSNFSTRLLDYTINYFPDQVQLLLLNNSLRIPTRPNGNAGAVVDYLFCPSFDFANTDLVTVIKALFVLPADQYAQALNRLTPSQFGALALNELENTFSIASSFFTRANQRAYCYPTCDSTHVWVNPIGLVYSQNNRSQISQEAIGFTNHTYGVVGGIDHVFNNDWQLGFGLGYSYSHLHWKDQAGKATSDSGYLAPRLGYDCEHFYFDLLVLAAGSFYTVDRNIVFPGVDRTANSHPTTWDLSEIALIGFKLQPFCKFFIQPEILLDQLNVFQESFHEKGADSINLVVKRKHTAFLRSLANLKFAKEWSCCNMCLVPSINVGWLRTTPLTGRHYTARLREGTFCAPHFSVTSFDEVVDQVLVSGQFLFSSQGCFSLSLGYDGRFGGGSQVNEVHVALDWKF